MHSKERVIRTLRFQQPDRIPVDLWVLPALSIRYGDALQELLDRNVIDIARAPYNDPTFDERHYQIGSYRDVWGSVYKRAARRLLRKTLASRHNRMPTVINTDKYAATEVAIAEEIYMGTLDPTAQHRMCQYLNNIVEQDHRFIKRRTGLMLGFKSWRSAYGTLIGIETMHMLRKGQAGTMTPMQEADFIRRIMVVA